MGGGGVGCRRHNRLCPASSILRNWAALMVPQLRTTHMYTHSLFWRVVIKLRMLSLLDIYPSCGSSAIPIGKCNCEQLKTRLLFPSKSDTNIFRCVYPPAVQYSCNEFHSTASQKGYLTFLWITVMLVPSIFERLMFCAFLSHQNM